MENFVHKLILSHIFLQQVESFRELYLTEQEQKLGLESELKDCKVL